jgi:hypothetical protein
MKIDAVMSLRKIRTYLCTKTAHNLLTRPQHGFSPQLKRRVQTTQRKLVHTKPKVSSVVKDLVLSGMWRFVVGLVVPDVLTERSTFIFSDHHIPYFRNVGNSLINEASRPRRLDTVQERERSTQNLQTHALRFP